MKQKLIDQLWKHTQQVNRHNVDKHWSHHDSNSIEKESFIAPLQIPAHIFFEKSASIFMSFHNESANANHHYHDFFEINYVIKGNPIGVINDIAIDLPPHSLCIMNPKAVHYFKQYQEGQDLILNLILPKETFEKYIYTPLLGDPILNAFFIRYQLENESGSSFLFLEHLDPSIEVLLELLIHEYLTNKSYSKIIIESMVTTLFAYILRSYGTQTHTSDHPLHNILDYIYANYNTTSLIEVSNLFNYHPKYLSSLIHKYNGETFRCLLTKIKLQNALYYLLYTQYTIEQIASLIGYAEKSSFFSSFKKKYGMTPTKYREHHTLH